MNLKNFYKRVLKHDFKDDITKEMKSQMIKTIELYEAVADALDTKIREYEKEFTETHPTVEEAKHYRRNISTMTFDVSKFAGPVRYFRNMAEEGYKEARNSEKLRLREVKEESDTPSKRLTVDEATSLAESSDVFKEYKMLYNLSDSLYTTVATKVNQANEVLHGLSSEFKDMDVTSRSIGVQGDYM